MAKRYTMRLSDALRWTDQAEVGKHLIFEEDEKGNLLQIWAMGNSYDEALANLEDCQDDWKNPTNREVVED